MPRFDGTGPGGAGPMTGWGRGYCTAGGARYGLPYGGGYGRGRGFRRGLGAAYGGGRGYGRAFDRRGTYAPWGAWPDLPNAPFGAPYAMRREDEISMLKDEADRVKEELQAINKRMEELESKPSE